MIPKTLFFKIYWSDKSVTRWFYPLLLLAVDIQYLFYVQSINFNYYFFYFQLEEEYPEFHFIEILLKLLVSQLSLKDSSNGFYLVIFYVLKKLLKTKEGDVVGWGGVGKRRGMGDMYNSVKIKNKIKLNLMVWELKAYKKEKYCLNIKTSK